MGARSARSVALCAAGISVSFVPATIAATSGVASAESGLATGVLNTAYQAGSSLGVAVLAAIAAHAAPGDGIANAFLAGGPLAFLGCATALSMLVRPAHPTWRPQTPRSSRPDHAPAVSSAPFASVRSFRGRVAGGPVVVAVEKEEPA